MRNRRRKSNERRGNAPSGRRNADKGGWHFLSAITGKGAGSKKKRRRLSSTQLRLLKLGVVLVCCVAGFIAVRAGMEYLYNDPEFELQVIDYETDGVIGRETIIGIAEISEGMKIMKLDIDGIQDRISAVPEVKLAKVERDLPNRLAITVEEREPIAWLSCRSANVRPKTQSYPEHGVRGLLVDANGVIMECKNLLPRYVGLPVIHLRELEQDRPGETVQPEQVLTALELLQHTRKMLFAEALVVRELKLADDYSVVAVFNNGTEAVFGLDELEAQVGRFRKIHAIAMKKNERIGSINLLVNRNIPVTSISKKPVADNILVPEPGVAPPGSADNRSRPLIRRRVSRDKIMGGDTGNIVVPRAEPVE